MKKLLSILLTAAMMISALGGVAFAAEDANVIAYFPLYGSAEFNNALGGAALTPPGDGHAVVGHDYLMLYRDSSAGNPDNTGHMVSDYKGAKVTGDQISFAFNAKVDKKQSRTPSSSEEASVRTIFLFGKSDYSDSAITLRYFGEENTSSVVLVQNGQDAVRAVFPRPAEDEWHSYAIALDGSAGGSLTVYVDGEQAASVPSNGIGPDDIGSDVLRLNRATSSNTVNVDSCYRDLRFINGLIPQEQARRYSDELRALTDKFAPTLSVNGGSEDNPVDTYEAISISHPAGDDAIYYTLDGSEPSASSTKYTGPFYGKGTVHVKACAVLPDGSVSQTAEVWAYTQPWSPTAAEYRIEGENTVNNVKVAWALYPEASKYEVYREGVLIGSTTGDCVDEYDLPVNKNITYTVKALDGGNNVLAEGVTNTVLTFATTGSTGYDDNVNGGWKPNPDHVSEPQPSGRLINGKYYSTSFDSVKKEEFAALGFDTAIFDKACSVASIRYKVSDDGFNWPDEWQFVYPLIVDMRLEGKQTQFMPDGETFSFSAHAEGDGFGCAKLFFATFRPGDGSENVKPYYVTAATGRIIPYADQWEQSELIDNPGKNQLSGWYVGRPFGYDSRDMVRFLDGDDLYTFSATNGNQDTLILKLQDNWVLPDKVMNVILKGQHQESPSVFHEGDTYYVYTSTTNGWFPSQARYSSAHTLDGHWTPLREVANTSTFGTQGNGVWGYGSDSGRVVQRGHGYNWGQTGGWRKTNYQRFFHLAINEGTATGFWCYRMEYDPYWGAIAVQSGEYVSLGKKATINGRPAPELTDNLQLQASPVAEVDSLPFDIIVDLEEPTVITEVNLTNDIYMGSVCASYYKAYGSNDQNNWTQIADVTNDDDDDGGFHVGWVTDTTPYRYVKVTVLDVKNIQNKNQSALWGGKPQEVAIYGKPVSHVDVQYTPTDEIFVGYDRKNIDFEPYGQKPVIENGRTLVPLRAIFETMGATVDWNNDTRTVTAARGDVTISLAIGSDQLYVNGEAKTLDVPAEIINGSTMVPARAVAEAFGCEVNWNNDARRVYIEEAE